MGMNRVVLQEMKEAEAWRNSETRADSRGRKVGLRKCRTCGDYKPSEAKYWLPTPHPTKKHKWSTKCVECGAKGIKQPHRGAMPHFPINFEKAYDEAIVAYQTLVALSARMYHLLEAAKPYLDGAAWQVELIEKEWMEIVK